MTKIVRSIGDSYTELNEKNNDKTSNLLRGVYLTNNSTIKPQDLSTHLREHNALIIRETISIFDKIIPKQRRLINYKIEDYISRILLSEAIWKLILEKFHFKDNEYDKNETIQLLRNEWLAKAHPYAKFVINFIDPGNDGNGIEIYKSNGEYNNDSRSQGRWYNAFWATNGNQIDYKLIASKVVAHLFTQEVLRNGEVKRVGNQSDNNKNVGVPTKKGIIEAKGLSITKSTNDPRKPPSYEKDIWSKKQTDFYFEKCDIVKKIYDTFDEVRENYLVRKQSWFGNILYEHFGSFKDSLPKEAEEKEKVWALHNQVRNYYKKLAATANFKNACHAKDNTEIKQILPKDRYALQAVLNAKNKNTDISRLIRLGKLIVHASNIEASSENPNSIFEANMNMLVKSDGQSQIKRNEVFARIFRKSTALALRTLQALADPKQLASENGNSDIAGANVAKNAIQKHYNDERYKNSIGLIFGEKLFDDKKSRSSIFTSDNLNENKENLWALMRIAGEIRNSSNHFNTRDCFIKRLLNHHLKQASENKKSFINYAGTEVSKKGLDKFKELLTFDLKLKQNMISEAMHKNLEFTNVTPDQYKTLFTQLSLSPDAEAINAPRFRATLNLAQNLDQGSPSNTENVYSYFRSLDLTNSPDAMKGLNKHKLNLLKDVYQSGFQNWISDKSNSLELIQEIVQKIKSNKQKRSDEYRDSKKQFYKPVTELLEHLSINENDTLKTIFAKLSSQAIRNDGDRPAFNKDKSIQKEKANEIEQFKQELFIHLFHQYLHKEKLDWINNLEEQDEQIQLDTENMKLPLFFKTSDDSWHSQFYAWLYLIPNDDVSMLKHQLIKSSALEVKSNIETDEKTVQALNDMVKLMTLYTSVQTAGFSGEEHVDDMNIGHLFYEDPAQFSKVYSQENEEHHFSFPGTRRGLRNVVRFGHLPVLKKIYQKHKVTTAEVDSFTQLDSKETKELFAKYNTLREDIIKESNSQRPDDKKLIPLANQYKPVAIDVALHNFNINAARLSEYSKLHQLMTRIVARLSDYTLIWERDRTYILLGMLYEQTQGQGFEVTIEIIDQNPEDKYVCLKLNSELKAKLLEATESFRTNKETEDIAEFMKQGFIPLWKNNESFREPIGFVTYALLNNRYQSIFKRYFIEGKNPLDKDRKRKPPSYSKTQIRNDFAHYNMFATEKNGKTKNINLTYMMNSVRSLMSYDRKLKNAVSKSIIDIVEDEGVQIKWRMKEDRLSKPVVSPKLEQHLTMLPTKLRDEMSFLIPRASVKYTSMIRALFDFGNSGNWKEHKHGKGETLSYCDDFIDSYYRREIDRIFVKYQK